MIAKEKFVQYLHYIEFLLVLVEDNKTHKHIRGILALLHTYFPKDENNFSHLEHYIFDNNFGKPSLCSDYECPTMLYERLIKTI